MIEKCGICQEDTIDVSKEFVTLPCAGHHAFHPDCIKSWLVQAPKQDCPFCRASLQHSCGHVLAAAHLQPGKVVDSGVLAGPCRPECGGLLPTQRSDREFVNTYAIPFRHALARAGRQETDRRLEAARRREAQRWRPRTGSVRTGRRWKLLPR
ncbi:hypothetical protein PG994_010592 [Apiospora phragmitis]|uniref:RING-type domain-containing protein n=1 Tax=Apiospora phragmitis TaxID=2905665 RepID=A0ABR1TQT9_9PEZI